MALRIAVLGATGMIGREILSVLAERQFPADEVIAVASRKSVGREVTFGDVELKAKDVDSIDWSTIHLCIMAIGDNPARKWGNKISATGCIVIDTSRAFRMDPQVPLVVPEVNASAVEGYSKRNLVASPDGLTTMLAVALKPIHDRAGIERAVVATYQSTSSAGRRAMDELWSQTKGLFVNQAVDPKEFPRQIAFNVIPQIDEFMDDGSTEEEWRLAEETRKIIDSDIQLIATCVRVPVFVGHGQAVHLELSEPLSAGDARSMLRESPGIMVVDKHEEENGYVTPIETVGEWATYISRIRNDPTVANGLAMWVTADNLRNGSALNAVQIAELLLNRGVFKPLLGA
jgi:aspartate-semialdehyde dehydrogenase